MYEKPEVKASLEVILSVFAVGVLAFFAVRPTITNIFVLQKKIEDQEVLLTKAKNKVTQLLLAEEKLGQPGFDENLFKSAVPDKFTYVDVLSRIEKIANENQLVLESLNLPGEVIVGQFKSADKKEQNMIVDDGKGHKLINIGFSVSGQQTNILNFMKSLESMDRVAMVKNISITKTKKALGQAVSTITISGQVTYYALSK